MKDYIYNPKMECMPKGEMLALQSELLRRQVNYVWENQPPYRQKMQEAGITPADIKDVTDVVKLPFTDKDDLRNNYPFGMLAVPREQIIRINATSGTTDKMTIVPCTQKDVDLLTESICRTYAMIGCQPGFMVQNAFSYSLFIGGMGAQNAVEKLGGIMLPTSTGNTKRQLQLLKDLQADNLSCTPSYAMHIAEIMEEEGYSKDDFALESCLVAGEGLKEEQYNFIREKLGVDVFDVYGNAEMTNVFAPCKYDTGKHIPEDMIYVEILDNEGNPLPAGQAGELVVTTLQKTGQPIIRYRTHDVAIVYDSPCPCGRTGRRLSKILGRIDDMVTVKGCKVFPSMLENAVKGFDCLTDNYCLVITKNHDCDELTFNAELKRGTSEENLENRIAEALRGTLGLSVKVQLYDYGVLPPADGHKRKLIYDRR
ncbi:MAG: phenylacetate--CoA ligase family protein [Candidatus Coproplasma sp.]